jgi:hypothetical protein
VTAIVKKTWRELEAEGVRRCCAHFTSGKQCRRRASEKFEFSWCEKHGPIFERIDREHAAMMKRTRGGNAPDRRGDEDDDE